MKLPEQIARRLAETFGLEQSTCSEPTLRAAVRLRMAQSGQATEEAYWELLQGDKLEFRAFVDELLIPESWFFRDRLPFDYLKSWVQKEWMAGPGRSGQSLRILSLPCAAGQEPYSIAITLLEAGLAPEHFSILAGDLSPRLLALASKGLYRRISFRGEDYVKLVHYFDEVGACLRVKPHIRELVNFQQMNLMQPADYAANGPFQLIFCRNVLIYFDDASRHRAFSGLAAALSPDGIFFAGHADSIFRITENFAHTGPPGAFCYARRALPPKEQPAPVMPAHDIAATRQVPRPRPATPQQEVSLADKQTLAEARRLADSGRLAEAEAICRTRMQEDATRAEHCFLLGEILLARRALADAEAQFRRAVYLDPGNREALFRLAHLTEQRGDHREAANWRRRAARRKPQLSEEGKA